MPSSQACCRHVKRLTGVLRQLNWTSGDTNLQGYVGSRWAGVKQGVKSDCMKARSMSKSTVLLSSGDERFFALTKLALQRSGLISMARNFAICMARVVDTQTPVQQAGRPSEIAQEGGAGTSRYNICGLQSRKKRTAEWCGVVPLTGASIMSRFWR